MTTNIEANAGSFRDPANRVYELNTKIGKRILRGLNEDALENYKAIVNESFFKKFINSGKIIGTTLLSNKDKDAKAIIADGGAGV